MMHDFPYTDLHELNLDWFLDEFKKFVKEFKKLKVDFKNLEESVPSGDFVPMEVRQAIFNILDNNAFANDHAYTGDLAVIEAWATGPVVTLTGISAVYTQSGTVYDTATLDSLKSDLVVTANYDDDRSVPVTDYTLQGELTVGTSTITVSYGGKTTTFNVTVSAAPVPETIALEAGTISETSPIGTSYDACKTTHAVRYRTVEPIAVNIGDVINFSITGVNDTLGIYGLWFDSNLNYTGVHFESWDYAGTYTVDQSYPYFGFACRTEQGQSNINASTAILTATITR